MALLIRAVRRASLATPSGLVYPDMGTYAVKDSPYTGPDFDDHPLNGFDGHTGSSDPIWTINSSSSAHTIPNKVWDHVIFTNYPQIKARQIYNNCIMAPEIAPSYVGEGASHGAIMGDSTNGRSAYDSVFNNCLLTAENVPSVNQDIVDGIQAGNYTMNRSEIRQSTDGIGAISPYGLVRAYACWIHNGIYMATTRQGDGFTHDDGSQVHNGPGNHYRWNHIGGPRALASQGIELGDDWCTSAVLVSQTTSTVAGVAPTTSSLLAEDNIFQGGAANVQVLNANGNNQSGSEFRRNIFMTETGSGKRGNWALMCISGAIPNVHSTPGDPDGNIFFNTGLQMIEDSGAGAKGIRRQ